MEAIWWTQDRLGREVILTTVGRDHIGDRHRQVADRLDEVRSAVEHPDFVTYRPVPPQGTWVGEVVTAYRVEERDEQEAQRWP